MGNGSVISKHCRFYVIASGPGSGSLEVVVEIRDI